MTPHPLPVLSDLSIEYIQFGRTVSVSANENTVYGSTSKFMATKVLSTRKVVIIGLPKSGKSTIANQLFMKKVFDTSTAGSAIRRHEDTLPGGEILLDLTIIRAKNLLDPENTKAYYRDFMPEEVSLVLFVCKYPAANDDLLSLRRVSTFFDGVNGRTVSALLVTFCDNLSYNDKRAEEEAFLVRPEKAGIGNSVKRIYCVGFEPNDATHSEGNAVEECRREILNLVKRSNFVYQKQSIIVPSLRERISSYCNIL